MMNADADKAPDQWIAYNYFISFIDLFGQRDALQGQGLLPVFKTDEDHKRFIGTLKDSIGSILNLQARAPCDFGKFLNIGNENMNATIQKRKGWVFLVSAFLMFISFVSVSNAETEKQTEQKMIKEAKEAAERSEKREKEKGQNSFEVKKTHQEHDVKTEKEAARPKENKEKKK
jgi:hypothetical protein